MHWVCRGDILCVVRSALTFLGLNSDNVLTARSIAAQCGIFTTGGVIMEGPAFRKLTEQERFEIVPRLQVLHPA